MKLFTGDDQALHAASKGRVDAEIAAFVASGVGGFAAVEVILAGFAFHEFARCRRADAFGDGFVSLEHSREL